jgi:2-methylcitrate dehydratase PrpD
MTTIVHQLVDVADAVRFEDLPSAVVSEAKRLLLDSIGCAVAALGTDKGRMAVQVATAMGGAPEARIFGVDGSVSASAAAFANGELINTLDYDALISPPGHVTPYVLPAIFAFAETHRSSGRDLIRALAIAHEVSARFGQSMGDVRDVAPGEKISFPAITGYSSSIFGGALGTAMIAHLDRDQAASALGLAGHIAPAQSMGKWVRTMPASTDKYVMAGWISQAEILAVNLAKAGYRGDVEVLEGEFGFWRYMGSGRTLTAGFPRPLWTASCTSWRSTRSHLRRSNASTPIATLTER